MEARLAEININFAVGLSDISGLRPGELGPGGKHNTFKLG
jgi:hypothetical protein